MVANEEGRALPELTTTPCVDGTVQLDDVEVRTPDGKQLIKPLDMRLEIGDTLVITGPSGSGKTTLLRSLAELWPFTSGTLTRPCGPNETMFLSQMPYVPLGDLRAVVSYPGEEGTIDDRTLQHTLQKVALPHLVDRLDEVQDWAKVLSPGEQQRIAFARILLTKPKVVFLRRGHVRAGRRPGVHSATTWCARSCRTPFWSASATAPPSSSITPTSSNCSATANGDSAGWKATKRNRLWCNAVRVASRAWKRSRRPWIGATS